MRVDLVWGDRRNVAGGFGEWRLTTGTYKGFFCFCVHYSVQLNQYAFPIFGRKQLKGWIMYSSALLSICIVLFMLLIFRVNSWWIRGTWQVQHWQEASGMNTSITGVLSHPLCSHAPPRFRVLIHSAANDAGSNWNCTSVIVWQNIGNAHLLGCLKLKKLCCYPSPDEWN
jgi:hypothetical protein